MTNKRLQGNDQQCDFGCKLCSSTEGHIIKYTGLTTEVLCAAVQQNASMALRILLLMALAHEGHGLFVAKDLLLSLRSNAVDQCQQCDLQY